MLNIINLVLNNSKVKTINNKFINSISMDEDLFYGSLSKCFNYLSSFYLSKSSVSQTGNPDRIPVGA